MSKPQLALVAHALLLIAAMWMLVPALTAALGTRGYLLVLVIYWLCFCLPVIAIHVWRQRGPRLFSERLAWRDWWVPLLLLAQVTASALFVFTPHTSMLSTSGVMLAAIIGIINGPLEETAWRGGFLTVFVNRPRLGFWLGWVLFTAWHVPLALATNVELAGGWPVLIGGAAVLGLFWSVITWRTGSVFWTSIAHGLTSTLTFWVFLEANQFV